MTLTFEFDLDSDKINQHAKYLGPVKGNFVQKLLFAHTNTPYLLMYQEWSVRNCSKHNDLTYSLWKN